MSEPRIKPNSSLKPKRAWAQDPTILLVIYAAAVPLSPQFNLFGIPDIRPTDLIIVFVVLALMGQIATNRDLREAYKTPQLLGPLLAMVIWSVVRMFISPGYEIGSHSTLFGIYYNLKRLEYAVVFMVAYTICLNPGACSKTLRALVLGSIGFTILILYEFHSHSGQTGFRASAFGADQPNQAAVFIVGIGAVAACWMRTKSEKGHRAIGILVLVIGAAALLATGSKEGLVAAVLAGAILAVRRQQWSVVMLTCLIGLCAWPLFPADVRDRYAYMLYETERTWQAVTEDPTLMPSAGSSSLAGRVIIAQYEIENVIPNCFWTGNGMGFKRLGYIDDTYLFEWISNGLIGVLLLGYFLFGVWMNVRSSARSKDDLMDALSSAMEVYLVVCVVGGLAMETFYVVRPMELFHLLLGMMCGRARYLSLKASDRSKMDVAAVEVEVAPLIKGRKPLPRGGFQPKRLPGR